MFRESPRPGGLKKWQISGLVRMETPVLYFDSQPPTTLSVFARRMELSGPALQNAMAASRATRHPAFSNQFDGAIGSAV